MKNKEQSIKEINAELKEIHLYLCNQELDRREKMKRQHELLIIRDKLEASTPSTNQPPTTNT